MPLFVATILLIYLGNWNWLRSSRINRFEFRESRLARVSKRFESTNFHHAYLLLIEFEGRTVRYGPSFFRWVYGTSAKCTGKTRFFNLQYGPRKTKLVRYLLYLLIQIEGKKILVQAERPVMINERQILSTRIFYWLPIKTGLWVKSSKYSLITHA